MKTYNKRAVISVNEKDQIISDLTSLCPSSKVKLLNKTSSRLNLVTNTPDMAINARTMWSYFHDQMLKDDKFKKHLKDERRLHYIQKDHKIALEYIEYRGLKAEYSLFFDPCWEDLQRYFAIQIKSYGIYNLNLMKVIEADGDYNQLLSQYLIKHADPELIKITKQVYATYETFKSIGKDFSNLIYAINQMTANNKEISIEEVHRLLHINEIDQD